MSLGDKKGKKRPLVDGLSTEEKQDEILAKMPILESNGAVPVNVQDQHSEVIDLHLSQYIQDLSIAINTTINTRTFTVTTVAIPTVGNMVCLKEGTAFFQAEILSVVVNGANWDVKVDTPLDYAFTTAGACSERNANLAVDGSITPVDFSVSPANLAPGTQWDIVRITFQIISTTSMDDAKFGGITALANGIVARTENGITKNIFNAKSNGDMAVHMYDIAYSDKAPAGFFGFRSRRTFGGQSKNGVTLRLDADTSDTVKIIVQDDLTGLTSFNAVAQGHIVTD